MKIILLSSLVLLNSFINPGLLQDSQKTFCELLKKVQTSSKLQFRPSDHVRVNVESLRLLPDSTFKFLNSQDKPSGTRSFMYGTIKISNTRNALICFNQAWECDQEVEYFSLHLVDKCEVAKNPLILSTDHDDSGTSYETQSFISKDLKTITLLETNYSEWLVGAESNFDTLFTTVTQLDLRSNNLDTLKRTTSYKIVKVK